MKEQIGFRYCMSLAFDGTVRDHHYTLKCLPESNLRQTITALDVTLPPGDCHWESQDTFGNRELLGVLAKPHDSFYAEIAGAAVLTLGEKGTILRANPKHGGKEMILYPEEKVRSDKIGIFRYPTALTRPGSRIQEYWRCCAGEGTLSESIHFMDSVSSDPGEKSAEEEIRHRAGMAVHLMHCLHGDMTYRKEATDVHTTAEEAMEKGTGVCQDYAHIYVSLLRLAGIPARYVTGMLRGEGESHAWAEAALGDYWYGLDPTNDCAAAGEHVKIGAGRDYNDCRISQGVFYGKPGQHQDIQVSVQRL